MRKKSIVKINSKSNISLLYLRCICDRKYLRQLDDKVKKMKNQERKALTRLLPSFFKTLVKSGFS